MSIRRQNIETDSIIFNIRLKAKLTSVLNHNGVSEVQIKNVIEEFKERIEDEICSEIVREYRCVQFLESVDFVDYSVEVNEDSKEDNTKQIELLERLNKRLDEQYSSLFKLTQEGGGLPKDQFCRINGKLEGVMLAIENNRQEILNLKTS